MRLAADGSWPPTWLTNGKICSAINRGLHRRKGAAIPITISCDVTVLDAEPGLSGAATAWVKFEALWQCRCVVDLEAIRNSIDKDESYIGRKSETQRQIQLRRNGCRDSCAAPRYLYEPQNSEIGSVNATG